MRALFLLGALLLCSCAALTPLDKAPGDSQAISLWYPGAVSVQLVGDWNGWGGLALAGGVLDPTVGRMSLDGQIWSADLDLPRGRYRYAFIIDGSEWTPDPMNPQRSLYDGHEVSVLVVEK